jgi:hypothetical protein
MVARARVADKQAVSKQLVQLTLNYLTYSASKLATQASWPRKHPGHASILATPILVRFGRFGTPVILTTTKYEVQL